MKNLIFSLFVFLTFGAFAHEGHDNSSLKSQYGGMIKRSANFYAEVVQEGSAWQIYVMDHHYKLNKDKSLVVSAEVVTKEGKKNQALSIKQDFFEFIPALKNEKHFKLNVSLKNKDKTENVEFNLETVNN
jgi:hypothetical protein